MSPAAKLGCKELEERCESLQGQLDAACNVATRCEAEISGLTDEVDSLRMDISTYVAAQAWRDNELARKQRVIESQLKRIEELTDQLADAQVIRDLAEAEVISERRDFDRMKAVAEQAIAAMSKFLA
jgi:chromosome segregation ATPase